MNQSKVFLKNSTWYVFGSSIQGLTPFLLTPFLTRSLNQEKFSEYVLFIAIGTILSFLFSLGLPAALTRNLILEKQDAQQNLESVNYLKRVLILISLSLLAITWLMDQITLIIFAGLALAFSLAVVQIDMAVYRAQQKASKFVFNAVFSTAIPTLFMTLGIMLEIIGDYFISFYTLCVFAFVLIINLNLFFKKFTSIKLKTLINLGWPTIPHGIGMSFMQYGDRIVLAAALGLAAAGQVQVAALIGTAPVLLLSTLNHAWIPNILEKFSSSKETGISALNKSTRYLSFLIFIISLALLVLNPWILQIFAPADYQLTELGPVVSVMLIASSIYIFYLRNTHVLTYLGKFQSFAWITPVSISLQILLIFLLVSFIGIIAAAIGFLMMVSSQAVLTQFVIRKLEPSLNLVYSPLLFTVGLSLLTIFLIK